MIRRAAFAAIALVLGISPAFAASVTIDVDLDHPAATIPPTFYGLMTEEINHSYDGGLFAELIQNRTFQDPALPAPQGASGDLPVHWSVVHAGSGAKVTLEKSEPVTPALPVSLRVEFNGGQAGVANDGYWGIPVRPDTKYAASFYAKGAGGFARPVTAAIVTDDGATVSLGETSPVTDKWQKYTLTLVTAHDAPITAKAKFVLTASGEKNSAVLLSLVSLFPPTYQDTPNGLRADLMTLMADMHPAFIRLPGGNYVEGRSFADRFNWKQMIGRAEDRPGHMGCWSYRSSDGFGIPEYLLWCKQLNAEPVLALFAGYTLDRAHVDAGSADMQKYTDEALQEIEYVSGPADSEWGKRRAADGFAEPFKLHYVEIGNEDWFDRSGSYDGRFTQMFDAIRKKYPDLKIIATAPVKSRTPDLYDDHYYRSAAAMADGWDHYDPAPANGSTLRFTGGHWDGAFDRNREFPKIFVGEWATEEGSPTPTLRAALADAVWLMGLERNADIVPMECYAPLFCNVNPEDREKHYPRGWQWRTNLIGYDAMSAFGSPSYYAQAIFGQNKGDHVLPTRTTLPPPATTVAATEPAPHGAFGVGSWHTDAEYKDISVTAADGSVLLAAEALANRAQWKFMGSDAWQTDAAGVVRSNTTRADTWAIAGDASWTDYTIRLKVRKHEGSEGFLILYHATDPDNFFWWNVGGWRNTRTQIEDKRDGQSISIGRPSDFKVEANRWYDLRVDVRGDRVRCYIDDKLTNEVRGDVQRNRQPRTTFFASAASITASNEVVVKVVNLGDKTVEATLNLHGDSAAKVSPNAKMIVLTGAAPGDMNSIEQPTKIAPKEEAITDAAATIHRAFPPYSLTLLRLKLGGN